MSTFMHPTNRESMLLTVQQEDPESSKDDSEKPDKVSEDELDMILATMGTTSLKDSELAQLQNDVVSQEEEAAPEEEVEEIVTPEPSPPEARETDGIEVLTADVKKAPVPEEQPPPAPRNTARRVVGKILQKVSQREIKLTLVEEGALISRAYAGVSHRFKLQIGQRYIEKQINRKKNLSPWQKINSG